MGLLKGMKENSMGPIGTRRFNRKIIASMAVIGLSAGGLVVAGAGAGASVGNSSAKVTVGSKTYKLSGGACLVEAGTVNVGIGQHGNSVAIHGNIKNGKLSGAQIGMVINKKPIAITNGSGKANSSGGSFKGTDVVSNTTVKGTFTC